MAAQAAGAGPAEQAGDQVDVGCIMSSASVSRPRSYPHSSAVRPSISSRRRRGLANPGAQQRDLYRGQLLPRRPAPADARRPHAREARHPVTTLRALTTIPPPMTDRRTSCPPTSRSTPATCSPSNGGAGTQVASRPITAGPDSRVAQGRPRTIMNDSARTPSEPDPRSNQTREWTPRIHYGDIVTPKATAAARTPAPSASVPFADRLWDGVRERDCFGAPVLLRWRKRI